VEKLIVVSEKQIQESDTLIGLHGNMSDCAHMLIDKLIILDCLLFKSGKDIDIEKAREIVDKSRELAKEIRLYGDKTTDFLSSISK
jgi:hypothetical protein